MSAEKILSGRFLSRPPFRHYSAISPSFRSKYSDKCGAPYPSGGIYAAAPARLMIYSADFCILKRS